MKIEGERELLNYLDSMIDNVGESVEVKLVDVRKGFILETKIFEVDKK